MAKKTADYIRTIVKALKDSSRYSEGLDIQILSLAGAILTLELANDDIDGLDSVTMQIVSRYGNDTLAPHPAFKIQKDAQESVTKQMKALGLTAEQLMGADENDPLIELGTKILDATKKTSKTIKPAKKK